MSIEKMALVLHHSRARGTAKLVLLGIANHAGDGGAWPAVETLARYANVHPRNVQHALDKLVELGELERHIQAGGTLISHASDWLRPNRYDVLVACPEGCARDDNHKPRLGWKRTTAGAYVPVDNGVAIAPPGGASATRGGGAIAALTVHSTPTTNHPAASTTGVGDTPPCAECSARDLTECSRRQAKLARPDRHAYRPVSR